MSTVSYQKDHCPIAQALAELGDQWTLLIVRDVLLIGPRRFNELQQSLGISRNLLTRRLVQLCDAGILDRVAIPGTRRHVYEPTGKCRDLRVVILAMASWAEKWVSDPCIHRLEALERASGKPVSVEFLQAEDGTVAEADDVEVIRHRSPANP